MGWMNPEPHTNKHSGCTSSDQLPTRAIPRRCMLWRTPQDSTQHAPYVHKRRDNQEPDEFKASPSICHTNTLHACAVLHTATTHNACQESMHTCATASLLVNNQRAKHSCLLRAHLLVAKCRNQPKCRTRLDTKYIEAWQGKVAMHAMPPSTLKHFLVGRLCMAHSMALQ